MTTTLLHDRTDPVAANGCDWCEKSTADVVARWDVRSFSHRSGPVGPAARRITTRLDAGTRSACAGCAPLVAAGDVEQLATRNVFGAAVRGDPTADVLPHAELVGLFRAVDGALVR